MKKIFTKYFSDLSGVAATEFAIVGPVLVTLLIGTIDAGMYINDKMKIESAARTTVEYLLNQGGKNTSWKI